MNVLSDFWTSVYVHISDFRRNKHFADVNTAVWTLSKTLVTVVLVSNVCYLGHSKN